jgi:Fungal chitosanase of glycosyl hydrolase group 75
VKRFLLSFFYCLAAMTACADTISIIGVVIRSGTGERVAGGAVGLYAEKDKDSGGKLGSDVTSSRGVYGIIVKNVAPNIGKLWVLYEGTDGRGVQEVDLTGSRDAVRSAKVDDLQVQDIPKDGKLSPEATEKLMVAANASSAVKAKAGVKPSEEPLRIGLTNVYESATLFRSGLEISADGSPRAYGPPGKQALDFLGNAGRPGNWWGLIKDESGNPVVQSNSDPAPGYYISFTQLQDPTRSKTDPRRYVDAETIPYITVPPQLIINTPNLVLGNIAAAVHTNDGKQTLAFAIVADVAPSGKLGEGSIALANKLGIPSDVKHGGTQRGVIYKIFPNSTHNWPKTVNEIDSEGRRLLEEYGGVQKLLSAPQ